MINLFSYLLISNIFTGSFVFSGKYFDFYIGYIFMILFLFFCVFYYGKIFINKGFIFILLLMSTLSLFNVFLGNISVPLLLKTAISFIFNGVVYYSLIRINNNKVEKLFRIYLKMACIVAAIGIFQEISFLTGFRYGYDYKVFLPNIRCTGTVMGMLKITSILQEPAHFGAVMAPAMFVSILNIIKNGKYFISKKISFLILISTLLSFSLVTYIGITVAVILIMFNYQKARFIAVCAIILFTFAFLSYRYLPDIRIRTDDVLAVMNNKVSLEKVNPSTFSFWSNVLVARKNFINNPLFGAGLGRYQMSYDRYITQVTHVDEFTSLLNRTDAGSLFLRLISETGLFGIILFFYFIFRFYVSRKQDGYFWVISNAIVCLFVLNLLRMGNYFYNGFIFFIWAYYFMNKNITESSIIKSFPEAKNIPLA